MRILGLAMIRILSSIFCNVCLRVALLFALLAVLVDCLVNVFDVDEDEVDETGGDRLLMLVVLFVVVVFGVEVLFELLFNKFGLLFVLATIEPTDFN
jgi:hypothetical protein